VPIAGEVGGAAATFGSTSMVAPAVRNVGAPIGLVSPQASVIAPQPLAPQSAPVAYAQPAAAAPVIVAAQPVVAPQLPDAADAGTLAQRAMQFFNEKNYAAALDALERRASMAPETTELRMVRGWSLLHLQRPEEARKAFATLGKSSPGQSLQGAR
jgi:hypothetical protein